MLPAEFAPPRSMAVADAGSGLCPVQVGELKDLRSNPAVLGSIGKREVLADDMTSWVRTGLEYLLATPRADPAAAGLTLDVDIVHAYIQGVAWSKSANLLLRVRFRRGVATLGQGAYRGASTSLNWTSAGAEARGAFDLALRDLVQELRTDTARYCAPAPPGATVAKLPP